MLCFCAKYEVWVEMRGASAGFTQESTYPMLRCCYSRLYHVCIRRAVNTPLPAYWQLPLPFRSLYSELYNLLAFLARMFDFDGFHTTASLCCDLYISRIPRTWSTAAGFLEPWCASNPLRAFNLVGGNPNRCKFFFFHKSFRSSFKYDTCNMGKIRVCCFPQMPRTGRNSRGCA